MPLQGVIQRAFSAGELAPSVAARADTARYAIGLRTCRNFVLLRSGGAANRAGFKYIGTAGQPASAVKLYKWVFTAASDSTLIEAGDQYFRFYKAGVLQTVSGVAAWSAATAYVVGDLVAVSGVNYYCILAHTNHTPPNTTYWYAMPANNVYEIPTPYTAGSFNSPGPLRFSQNGADITITHTAYQPRILSNLTGNAANPIWTLTLQTTGPSIAAPAGLTATAGTPGTLNPQYKVTALSSPDTGPQEESLPSDAATCASSDTPTEAAPNALSWTAVSGAWGYNVYLDQAGNGTFGYIGTATGQTTFNDTGFAPDPILTPPQARVLFDTSLNYPEICGYYQQRQVFAYTDNNPWTVWASRIGFPKNFSLRTPLQDDDAVTFTMVADQLNVIRHLIRLDRLVLLTDGGEWLVRGDDTGALIPTAINLDQFGYNGAARAFPALVGNVILYVQARGSIVRDLKVDAQGGLDGRDLTLLATHLFESYTIGRLEYAQAPNSVVWAVRSDGSLLGCTYVPGEDLVGWHRHDTNNGTIEDICVVPEDSEDVLYAVILRTINGSSTRYIEKMASRPLGFTDANLAADGFFVDCGITKTGASSTSVTGLDHLEGESVYALADGLVQGPFTVSAGAITLTTAASTVHVGYRITADLESLDFDVQGTDVRDKRKRVQEVGVLVDASVPTFSVGPDTSNLVQMHVEPWDSATALKSDVVPVNVTAKWDTRGRVFIRQQQPVPLTVLGWQPRTEIGG